MLDDFRIEWLCRRTCDMLDIDRSIFIDMLERNNGFNEDLIDQFFNMNTALHERSYALIFHRADSTREVWQMTERIDDEDFDEFDEENDQQIILNVNEPIDAETEYPIDFVFNHARLSTGDTIDSLYEDLKNIQRLVVMNQYDNKRYHFELRSIREARVYCEYHHYHNVTKKTFVYFIRTDIHPYLTQSSTYEEMNSLMNENIFYGIVSDEQPLVSLLEILSFVYQDLLPPISKNVALSMEETSQHDQLRLSLNHFRLQIESTLRQMQGEFSLIVPEKNLVFNGEETEDEYVENLEYLVYNWESSLHQEMNHELNRQVFNSSPLDEVEFWHERSIRITSILEQMKKDDVMRIIHVLTELDSPSLSGFNTIRSQLHSYLLEATDNYKFLLTIERHLKILQMATSFQAVIHMLPNLMQGLKTIWTMSKHYNKDERFVPFMEKIANELISRVRQTIDITTLFSSSRLNEAKDLCYQAKQLLLQWKIEYQNTRTKLENDKRGFLTWNFEHRILFDKTDYMSQICDDLIQMATNLNEFYDIFGPDMKAVTGDEQMVDRVLEHVSDLKKSVCSCHFDIFNRETAQQWRLFMEEFKHRSSMIEQAAKGFIHASFTQLRSAETALDMLMKFEQIDTTHVLAHEMIRQLTAILTQYCKEMDGIYDLFIKYKNHPPVFKGSPPIAGAIQWTRFLFARIKLPMIKFRSVDQLLQSEQGTAAKQRFIEIGSLLKEYEGELYTKWLDKITTTLPICLKQNLLIDAEQRPDLFPGDHSPAYRLPLYRTKKDMNRMSISNDPSRSIVNKLKLHREKCHLFQYVFDPMGTKNKIEIKYLINHDVNFKESLMECYYLEKLGFNLPESLIQTTLQSSKFEQLSNELRSMLEDYHLTLASLDTIEVSLLQSYLDQIQKTIQPGISRISWGEIGTLDYVNQCKKQLEQLHSILNQIRNISTDIREHLESFRFCVIDPVVPKHDDGTLFTCREYFEFLDNKRKEIVSSLKRRYDLIGPLLIKIEALVFGTSTGKHQNMHPFYNYWEHEIFTSLVQLVIHNLCQFFENIFGTSSLFTVDVILAPPRMKLQPPLEEIINSIRRSAHGISELPKQFTRWLHGTCIPCPSVPIVADDFQSPDFTFNNDVKQHPDVISTLKPVRSYASGLVTAINRILTQLLTYNDLWKIDKQKYASRFALKSRPYSDYDEIMTVFSKVNQTFDRYPIHKNISSIQLSLKQFYHALKYHCKEWISSYGQHFYLKMSHKLKEINEVLNYLSENLHHQADTVPDLKFVLNIISQINQQQESIGHDIHDIEQSYRILQQHHFEYPPSDGILIQTLTPRLTELLNQSQLVQYRLKSIRERFREIIQYDIEFFQGIVDELVERFDKYGPYTIENDLPRTFFLVKQYEKEVNKIEQRKNELINVMTLFHIPLITYPDLIRIQKDINGLNILSDFYEEFHRNKKLWSNILWTDLDINELITNVDSFIKNFRHLPPEIKTTVVGQTVEKYLTDFRSSLPIMVDLKNEALRERHWKQIIQETKIDIDLTNNILTLENIFQMNLHQYNETIQNILQTATKELQIEKNLQDIQQQWETMRFQIQKHVRNANIPQDRGFIISGVDDILQALEDSTLLLNSITTSRFVGIYLSQVEQWIRILSLISDVIKVWTIVQQKWLYLENIFLGSNLQFGEETKRFETIDKLYRKIMLETSRNSLVKDSCTHPGRYDELKSILNLIEKIQKNLNEYLDTKRQFFPRFYFLSDDELLSIIGSANPKHIQGYLQKMFDNISALSFTEQMGEQNSVYAQAMISLEKEQMNFVNPVDCNGKVEVWMSNIEKGMKDSNRWITKEAIFYYRFKQSRLEWMRKYIGMVVLAVNQLWSTWEIEDQFDKMITQNQCSAMKMYVKQVNSQIEEIVLEMRKLLTPNEYNKFETVLIIDVHTRDMVDILIRDGISEAHDFAWQCQLRFYWLAKEDNLFLQQCNGKFQYGYEYMGLNGRLVITPLTDRIYLTITQALSMYLGCAPAGPAGTGKTESVKDLAKAMGLLCVVTNCGEGMDYQAIGKNLNGLCQTGAWGCFDEFNRIEASVLSVVSTQVKSIQQALSLHLQEFLFQQNEIRLISTVGIFITMNPGYAGRTELPESVKTLFRPVVVIIPDMQYIGEIKLFANGFINAKMLAKKMVTLYRYASELLSKQYHYDWGLRSFKSVLSMAGYLKRGTMKNDPEEIVLLRALRDMNIPKFIYEDVDLFLNLLNDLFPNIFCPKIHYQDFNRIIEEILTNQHYILVPEQIEKMIQLYETMMTRHSTMVVGPTSGGKTVVLNTLAEAQTQMGMKTSLYVVNPKAISVIELYGTLDPLTREWTDGIVSMLYRMINRPIIRNERRYIVFDGDVDALWIENMNSVMDDNKLLTLANGERIRLQDYCSLLFEVGDLKYASPATVSRCGMVYVDPENLGPNPAWKRWLSRNFLDRSNEKDQLDFLYDRYTKNVMDFIYQGLTETGRRPRMKMIIPLTRVNIIVQLTKLLDSLLLPFLNNEKKDQLPLTSDLIHAIFLQAFIWSFGACLKSEDRSILDTFIKYLSGLSTVSIGAKAKSGELPNEKPLLFDHVFQPELDQWIKWDDLIPKYEHDRSKRFTEIFVATVDTIRLEWLIKSMLNIHQPVLFVGDTGSSKTATIRSYIRKLDSHYINLNLNFSSRTKSIDVQQSIESQLEKRAKDTYGPSAGSKLIIFLDDIAMPKIDQYGTQQVIALLKLLIEKHGMYERKGELNWKFVADIDWIAAMGTPGGGNNNIDPRFISHFSVFYISSPSRESLFRIFSTILQSHVTTFPNEIQGIIPHIINSTLQIYEDVLRFFVPTPLKSYYIFSLRDLSRIIQSLLQTTPERFDTIERFTRVWLHECLRVFSDRFNNIKDEELFHQILEKNLFIKNQNDYLFRKPILFGDYRTALQDDEPKIYEDLQDYPAIKSIFEEILVEFKEKYGGQMEIVLFDNALEHLTRIYRVLRLDRGHLLLIGAGGSGKKLLSKLAALTAKYQMFEIQLTRNYNEMSFREDLKVLFNQVGLKNIKTVFILNDAQIVEENFLEYINSILSNGMVPSLFTEEERDGIIGEIREEAMKDDKISSNENIWEYFSQRCTSNLHVILCMNPSGDLLRKRTRNFPALTNNTTIDYFARWPQQALYAVAEHFISRSTLISDDYKTNIIEHMAIVHESANFYCDLYMEKMRRYAYVTPKNYLDFIHTFLNLSKQKKEDLAKQAERLNIGIIRIDEASILIQEMDRKLEKQRKELAIKTKRCDDLLTEISTLTAKQTERKTRALEKKQLVDEQLITIEKEKHEAESQLQETMPALLEAQHGLDTLKAADITEMRSFANPVDTLRLIGYCMLIYLGQPSITWKDVRAVMADMKFITNLKTRDPNLFTSKQAVQLKIYLKKLEDKLDPNHLYSFLEKSERDIKLVTLMTNVSRVGGSLLKFIHAVDHYMDKYLEIKPQKDRLNSIEDDYETNLSELNRLEMNIEKFTNILNDFRKRFDAAMEEKIKFQEETDIALRRRTAAEKLLTGFKSETSRWKEELDRMKQYENELNGNCLLASAFLAYCGPFTYEIRQELLNQQWKTNLIEKKILVTENFQIQNFLSSNVEISEWTSQGLPADEFSIQNGILTLQSNRFPYCIDPQLQGLLWIKQREKKANLKILSMRDRDFLKHLELAIKYGYPVLFKDVDEYIDPIILDILSKNLQGDLAHQYVKLGDKYIDIDRNFRMYLTCRLPNPKFSTLHFSYSKVINYTVTLKGLEEQLLSSLVQIERRELEEMRETLIQEIFENKQQQKLLEDSLLRELTTSTGEFRNILDNTELIETLENTKTKVNQVIQALNLGEKTRQDIDKLRDTYRSAARRGAVLYFSLVQMSSINSMYQYSLNSFLSVFEYSVKTSQTNFKLDQRLQSIIHTLTYQIYCYGTTGMFEKHKLLYSFLLTIQIELDQQMINYHQIEFFLKGNLSLDKTLTIKFKPIFDWLTIDAWHHCLFLSKTFPEKFENLLINIQENHLEWKQWIEHDQPEKTRLPIPFNESLIDFEKLMLFRCFCQSRIIFAIRNYITKIMGEKYIIPPTIYFDSIFEQSTSQIPVIFILSPGSDPTNDIQKLADRKNQTRKMNIDNGIINEEEKFLRILAMGQNQEKITLQALHTAQQQGTWLLLQNCHLLLPFLSDLEKELETSTKSHSDFRLWMTTEPIDQFPIGLLQKSYKVVTEPPSTLKLNLRSTFVNLPLQTLTESSHPAFPCLIFILAFFHAIILDRRKYQKIGWSCTYDFNESDFRVSVDILKVYLNMSLKRGSLDIPWPTLRYLIGEVMYGGRVIDSYDRRIISTYMKEYFGNFVFDAFQPFHFFIGPTKPLKYDYFIPEIRDFLSIKQRWLLKEANISVEPQLEYHFEQFLPEKISNLLQRNMNDMESRQFDYQFSSKNVLFNQFFHYSIFRDLYLAYIDQLPLYNPADVLGLHANAEINYLTKAANDIYSNMLDIQPEQHDMDENTSREQFVLSLIDDILQQIPAKKDLNLIKQKFHQRLTPLTIVLFQEIQRFNLLTSMMWKSMNELKQALNGQISFSFELDEIKKYLYHGQIPLLWRSYAPQTKKSLANWIEHFRERNQQYEKWIQDGELKMVNLSGLHVPEAYLAAIVQTAARKNQWPLDKATFYTYVTKWHTLDDVDESIQGTCLIEGLYLEGAGWDRENHCLIEQSNKQLIQLMPLIKIIPVETHRLNSNNYLPTPVYVTSDRRNAMGVGLVFEASLYTKKDLSHWILNGVCLLLNTD